MVHRWYGNLDAILQFILPRNCIAILRQEKGPGSRA